MSQYYIFNEPGVIPGIPGTFAQVRIDIADDGTLTVSPLPQYPHFEAAEAVLDDTSQAATPEPIETEA
jgi:hypothetical protein